MSAIRRDLVYATINRAIDSIDYNIYNDIHKWREFIKQTILADSSLTNDEKTEAIRINTTWVDGRYEDWDSRKQQLKRFGEHDAVLKRLENVESANQSWFEEAKSHLTISNKTTEIVRCYGLTQNPSNGNYMLVLDIMDINLREYLLQNHNKLTWKEKINITSIIIGEIREIKIHYQNNPNELPQLKAKIDEEINSNTSSKLFTSKIHFENLPEPKNTTEEEQEAFHSKLYDFSIPKNIDDFGQSSNQNNKRNSNVIEAGSTRLTKGFKKLRVNSKSVDIQNKYYRDTIQQPQTGDIDDEVEIHNNPNLHSEEQDELEIPDDIDKL
ncbi:kinase-like domain-containing protein [Rhizophagus irregularis DAOM 181602=DAOM 197198]|nr:kinase-like domain-containing protein [Rhizophagus irregularis DAOM 181602=DAOM 197198]